MEDYEKLGVFYLGRPYNPAAKKSPGGLFLYDSKDLVTHAVCVGMTGSGKTGLCISLLEEAAMDGIPAIAIDPKGDLTNLLLTFPDLKAEDFRPWINEEDANKKGMTIDAYAAAQADLWKNGLVNWGQGGERIRRLKQAAEFTIYTPGSTAGIPVSILKSFAAPPQPIVDDEELLRERINSTATSLLGIIGIDADPIKSREHILISTLFNLAWKDQKDMDIAELIQQIQNPPVRRIGVMDVNSFYPAKERFALAMALNNLLAAPGFSTWLEGEPLEINSMFYTPEGKPKISVFSIAHLNDSERMFFVSLLLNQILGWMRTQSGTTSLRSIVYMDEIFGFFPPVANPPSKQPLLTLLKQARAFGVGIVLATQNPVDLDYKGLANAGTWFLGRLQTERDKARVLEGLEGVAANAGAQWDRQLIDRTLSGLSNRVFLMNNVHDDAPTIFETRWAMSYLRGPLTRNQIKQIMDPIKKGKVNPSTVEVKSEAKQEPSVAPISQSEPRTESAPTQTMQAPKQEPRRTDTTAKRPVLPPGITQYFVPVKSSPPPQHELFYQAGLLCGGEIHFTDARTKIDLIKYVLYNTPLTDGPFPVDWNDSAETYLKINELLQTPNEPAAYGDLPTIATRAESYSAWNKEFVNWLLRSQKVDLWRSPGLKEYSRINESERDFRIRLQQKAREQRDAEAEKLRQKYAPKIAALQEQVRRAQASVEREKGQVKQQQMEATLSFGATILGGFLGRKAGSLGSARSTMSRVNRSMKEKQDVARAEDTAAATQQRLRQLEAEFNADTAALSGKIDPLSEQLETISIRPTRTGIAVQLLALGWFPYWRSAGGETKPAW